MEDQFSLGAIPSPADYRDIPLGAAIPSSADILPASFFLEIEDLPIWHQRKIGACVGHAAAKYAQYLNLLETGKITPLSARFLYAVAKCRDDYADEGTYPRLVAKILKDHGCATEATIPNDTKLTHEEYVYGRKEAAIPEAAWKEAAPFKIGSYAFPKVREAHELKRAIIAGKGAMLLAQIGEEWWKAKDGKSSWKSKDIVPLRIPKKIVSGHEVFLYGYETLPNGRTKFYIINSWSVDWGISGKAWFYHDEYLPFLTEAITFLDIPNPIIEQAQDLPPAASFKHTFNTDIEAGQRGAEVKALQTALMIDGNFPKDLYAELLASNELGYFKPNGVTQKALLSYQLEHAVAPYAELMALNGRRAGAKTRAILNAQFGG